MSRYIDAYEAKRQIQKATEGEVDVMKVFLKAMYSIDKMQTADVRENVRGEWLQHTIDGNVLSIDKDTCSVCKETFYQISETGCVWNFCPNCGADMRGDNHD